MWLWVGTTFMVIFLNIFVLSHAEFDQFHGTCSILNQASFLLPRFVIYSVLYGGSLLTIFTCAVLLSVQSFCGKNPELDSSLAPSLLFYTFAWTGLLVKMVSVSFEWPLSPLADVVTTSAPELQVALNPLLVFWRHTQLRETLSDLVKCVACRAVGSGDDGMEMED